MSLLKTTSDYDKQLESHVDLYTATFREVEGALQELGDRVSEKGYIDHGKNDFRRIGRITRVISQLETSVEAIMSVTKTEKDALQNGYQIQKLRESLTTVRNDYAKTNRPGGRQ